MDKWEMVRLGDVCGVVSSNIAQKDLEQNEGEYPIYGASGLIKYIDFYKQDSEYIAVVKDGAGIGRTTMLPAKSSVIGTMQSLLPKKNVDAKYLYYATSSMNLAKYYTGSTIPHIYFKDYKKEVLPLPLLPVQQQIADVLDRASALIKKRKAQIEKLDLLIKSQFIEMFGDPVTNPMGWEVKKLGDIFDVGSSKRIYQNEQTTSGVPFFRISDLVKRIENATGSSKLYISDEQYSSFKLKGLVPKSGDILVTSRGTLGQCYIMCDSDKFYFQDGMISWLKKGKADVESIYITYLFMMKGFRKQIDEVPAGSTVNYLSIDRLEKLIIMYPDYVLQNTFATFVECVEVQKSLLQKSLKKLELNYKSLMQKCFNGEVF